MNRAILRQGWGELGRQLEYKESWAGGLVEYQSEAYSRQQCPACEYTSPLNRKTQEMFACVSPTCSFSANADGVAAANQLRKFLSSDKGQAVLASGYRASVNRLWSGRSRDSATKQEPIEEAAQCVHRSRESQRYVREDVKVRHRLTQSNTLFAESSALRYALYVHPGKQQIEANPFENAV